MYIYIHKHTHIHTHIHSLTYTHTHTHTNTHTHTYTHTHTHKHSRTNSHIYIQRYMYTYMYICICVFDHVNGPPSTSEWVLIQFRLGVSLVRMTHMGWLWLVGSLKILVSFAEYSLFCRALLPKRPMFLGSLLKLATPHHTFEFRMLYLSKWAMSHVLKIYGVATFSRLPENVGLFCKRTP